MNVGQRSPSDPPVHFQLTASNRPRLICILRLVGVLPIMMRKALFATWGILLLFSADHAFAEHFLLSFSKFYEAETSTVLALQMRMA
jgi:hypothetical protein